MTSFYMPSGKDDKGHICDNCECNDGMPTLYWGNGDFDLCIDCLSSLYVDFAAKYDKIGESITIKRKVVTEELRNKLLEKHRWKCSVCGSNEVLQIDHIIPFSKGGTTEEENLQVLYKTCNFKKNVN